MTQLLRAALTAAAIVLVLVPPASADDTVVKGTRQDVGVSLDGTRYQASLDAPLFDPQVRWVPGDVRTTGFWVRNQADEAGDLTIDLVPRARKSLFATGDLSVSARAATGPWLTVREGEPLRLLARKDVPSQAEVPVSIRVALAPEAPNGTMVLATDFDLKVTLVDARASGSHGDNDGPGGLLPDTGSPTSWWVVPLGLVLLTGGVLLLARRESARLPTTPYLSGEHR